MSFFLVDVFFALAVVLYGGLAIRHVVFLFGEANAPAKRSRDGRDGSRDGSREIGKTADGTAVATMRWFLAAAVIHACYIVTGSLLFRVCPITGVAFPLGVAGFSAACIYLVARTRYNIDALGAFVAPLSLTGLLASRFLTTDTGAHVRSTVLPFHILASCIGVTLFSMASFAAVLYLVQERRLKKKQLQGLFRRLPPLDALDRVEHRFLLWGFPLFTIGIVSGTLLNLAAGDIARTGLAYVTWVLIAGVLLLRAMLGWRGKRAALGTLAGFGFTLLLLGFYLLRNSVERGG
jgi:ABC-type uncharacterized transport system permease subunit